MKLYLDFFMWLHVVAFAILLSFGLYSHVFDCEYIDPYERYEMATKHDHSEWRPTFDQWMAEQEEKEFSLLRWWGEGFAEAFSVFDFSRDDEGRPSASEQQDSRYDP